MLTGIGQLHRVHEPASVETRDDGQKVLLPPREVIQFTPNKSLSGRYDDALVNAFTRSLQAEIENPREAIDETLVVLRKQLEESGEFDMEDVGSFVGEDGKVVFEPANALTNLVNKPFAGLPPIAPREEATAQEEVDEFVDEPTEGVDEPVTMEPAEDVEEDEKAAATVLEQLVDQTGKDDAEEQPLDESNEDAEIDEDIDALLANVWAPVATASGDENYDRLSRTSEMEEQSATTDAVASEEEDTAVPVVAVAAGTAIATSAAALMSPEQRARDRNAEPKKRRGMGVVLVPALLVLFALAAIVLWPRFTGGNEADSQFANDESGAASDETSDPLYATHAGGRADAVENESEDISTFESPQMLQDGDEPTSEDVGEPVAERPRQAVAPPENQSATPTPAPPPVARSEPAPRRTSNELPSQLRGPGEVNPAQGGSTWILASGNRTSAEELAARYRSQGYRSTVLPGEANGIAVYRVAVGQFADAAEARTHRSRLPSDAPASTWVLNF